MSLALSYDRAVIVVFASAMVMPAQTIWNPPSGAILEPWFAMAAPGDIIELNGLYQPFTLTKGLTLISPTGFSSIQRTLTTVFNYNSTISVPPGQRARMVGLRFEPSGLGHSVSVSGDASFEDCSVVAAWGSAFGISSGTVILQRCEMTAIKGAGVVLTGGICTMTHCNLHGGSAITTVHPNLEPADPGLRQTGGVLIASHVNASGGNAAPGSFPFPWEPAAPAVVCAGGTAWFSDSLLTGGSGLGFTVGAPALTATSSVSIARTSLMGGSPSTGFVNVPQLVGMAANGPIVRGANAVVVATAGSSQQLLGIVGNFDSTPAFLPPIVEPLFGAPAGLVVLALAVPGPNAAVQASVNVPNAASLYGSPVWFQAVQLNGAQIRPSTLVGGCIR